MILNIKVIPRASQNEVIKLDEKNFRVRLTASPVDGKANEKLTELLSEYFNTSKSKISILRGQTSKQKVVEVII